MKKHLISLLRDFGIEPTFLTISISILLIIGITFIVIHLILHKVILKSINKIDKKKRNFITSSLLEENLFQRLALVFQGLVVSNDTSIFEKAFNCKLEGGKVWLDGCLSRKKQIIPFLEPAFA